MAVVKAVRENNGVGNSPLWIDEAFDGLSEEFKVKAFGLLSAVSKDYSTIYVVEHSQELKSLFASQVKVSMINGRSTLEEA
jgi:DNA repair exonuclease SbcCD ATPase subunit